MDNRKNRHGCVDGTRMDISYPEWIETVDKTLEAELGKCHKAFMDKYNFVRIWKDGGCAIEVSEYIVDVELRATD